MKKLRFRFRLRTLLMVTAILAVCLAWFVNWWRSKPNISLLTMGGSKAMEPFLIGREYLAVDMNAYRTAKPARWEVVAIRLQPPARAGRAPTASVLRVVGLPGETVSFSEGEVLIDGRRLEPSPYVPPDAAVVAITHLQEVRYHTDIPNAQVVSHPYTVPDGCYYLLGDNPEAASDSRMWGALPEAEILGRYPAQISQPNRAWPKVYIALLISLAFCWLLLSRRSR